MADARPLSARLRLWVALGGVLVALFILAALFGENGVVRHEKLRDELSAIEAENARLAEANRRLAAQTRALAQDPAYQAHVVRDELGWVAADDVVLIFPDDKAP